MEKKQSTREEVLARLRASKENKRKRQAELVNWLKSEYKKRTGQEATVVEVW